MKSNKESSLVGRLGNYNLVIHPYHSVYHFLTRSDMKGDGQLLGMDPAQKEAKLIIFRWKKA